MRSLVVSTTYSRAGTTKNNKKTSYVGEKELLADDDHNDEGRRIVLKVAANKNLAVKTITQYHSTTRPRFIRLDE